MCIQDVVCVWAKDQSGSQATWPWSVGDEKKAGGPEMKKKSSFEDTKREMFCFTPHCGHEGVTVTHSALRLWRLLHSACQKQFTLTYINIWGYVWMLLSLSSQIMPSHSLLVLISPFFSLLSQLFSLYARMGLMFTFPPSCEMHPNTSDSTK